MNNRVESIRVMHPLFQEDEGGSTPTSTLSAKDLRIDRIPFERAKELNRLWHSRLPLFNSSIGKTAYMCFGGFKGEICYVIAIWSNPTAANLPQDTWFELRHMATAPDAPRNTPSRLLRVMELIIRKERPEISVLVSYQDTGVHTGGIYKGSGWRKTMLGDGRDWNRPKRSRPKAQSYTLKQRWEKHLNPPAAAQRREGDRS